jgi:hypothetical protein
LRSTRSLPIELALEVFELTGTHLRAPRPIEALAPDRRIEALAATQPGAAASTMAIDVCLRVVAQHTPNELGLWAAGSAPDARAEWCGTITG